MHRAILAAALGLIMLAAAGPASARGLGAAMEVEAARANARAGGPTNARDAELLERWRARWLEQPPSPTPPLLRMPDPQMSA